MVRWYPAIASPGVIMRGPLNGAWVDGDPTFPWHREHVFNELYTTKTNAGTHDRLHLATNKQANYDFNTVIYCTPPLEAITLSSTLQFCVGLCNWWETSTDVDTTSSVARIKVYAYISTGNTSVPRSVIIDNHVETVNIPAVYSLATWTSLDAPLAISGSILAGDRIVIELGIRVVSSPTPTPTYPPSALSHFRSIYFSNNLNSSTPFTDAIEGDTDPAKAAWVEFSQTLIPQALPTAPTNDACADAITIASLPFQSDFIDTTGSLETDKGVWYKWTAPTTGRVILNTLGCNYSVDFFVYTGGCGVLDLVVPVWRTPGSGGMRNLGYYVFEAVASTEYHIKLSQGYSGNLARNHGGSLRWSACYQNIIPLADDLYINSGWLVAYRAGQFLNFMPFFSSYAPSGVAIDYSGVTMYPIYDEETPHTDHRIVMGLHSIDGVEVLDLKTLNLTTSELDYEYDWTNAHPSQIYITRNGKLYVAAFGNGYLHVCGAGTLPATLNQISDPASKGYLNRLDMIELDNQPAGAAAVIDTFITAPGSTAGWAFTIDEATGIMYYATGGYYREPLTPLLNNIIKRYNLNTSTQLTDFATVVLSGTRNTGLKGLRLLSDGGMLVCNGNVVNRLSSAGAITQTYTPSVPLDNQFLVDLEISQDGTKFWVFDGDSARATQFNIATGVELFTFLTYLTIGASTQIAIYRPTPDTPSPTPPDLGGIYFINPTNVRDKYYTTDKKIPNPTIKTALLGE